MRFLVDLHAHTVASDHAYSTVHEYIMQAQKIGLEMIAITDHGPSSPDSPHWRHFANLHVIPHVVDNIAVLRGLEADIQEDGSLDLEDEFLNKLDIVLAGMHATIPNGDEKKHTEVLKKVIASGKVDIITHIGNPRFPINFREVLECAYEHNVAIELNASSSVNSRLGSHDNCVEVAKLAKEIGNVIALGSDSHTCYFLGNFKEAESVLEDAQLGYDKIINTSPMKVLDFLESRGHSRIESLHKFFTPY